MSGTDFVSEIDIVVERKDAPHAPEAQLGTYHLKRWTWYAKQATIGKATVITDMKRGIGTLKVEDFYAEAFALIITVPPPGLALPWAKYETRIAYIKNELDADVGDKIRDGCVKLTGIDKRSFLPPTEPENTIPG
jgi:hypothetical protein